MFESLVKGKISSIIHDARDLGVKLSLTYASPSRMKSIG